MIKLRNILPSAKALFAWLPTHQLSHLQLFFNLVVVVQHLIDALWTSIQGCTPYCSTAPFLYFYLTEFFQPTQQWSTKIGF